MEEQEILTQETEELINDLPKENEGEHIKKYYILKFNSIPYNFSIESSSNNYINFELRQADKISYDYYFANYNYEDILKLFNLDKNTYNNSLKVIELLENLFKKEKIFSNNGNDKSKIDLHIKLEKNSKEEDYIIKLQKIIMNEKKMMSIVIDEINQIKNEKNPKNDVKENVKDEISLEKELKNIDEEINKLSLKKEEIQNKINEKNHIDIINKTNYDNAIIINLKVNEEQRDKKIKYLRTFYGNYSNNFDVFINGIKYQEKSLFCPQKVGLYTIIIKFKTIIETCEELFDGCNELTDIDLSHLITKSVKSMESMFRECSKLQKINFSSFDTHNVTNMKNMFCNCKNLVNLNLSSFDTKNVAIMNSMFYCCYKLQKLNLSSFDTKNVIDMGLMFCSCQELQELNLSSFDTKNVTNMKEMFYGCENLVNLNLSSFNYEKVKNLEYIFEHCYILNKIKINKNSKKIKELVDENFIKLEYN